MNYKDIKDFNERCNSHPDHQKGIITERMLSDRLHEEILELRMYIEGKEWVGLTDEECKILFLEAAGLNSYVESIEQLLKEKNTHEL